MVKQISDNEIYLLIKYIKSILWRVTEHLSYIEDARCLKFKRALIYNLQRLKITRYRLHLLITIIY